MGNRVMAEKFRGVLQPQTKSKAGRLLAFRHSRLCFDVVARKTALRNSCPSCKNGLEFFIEGHVKKAIMEQNRT